MTHYDILEVSRNASPETIRAAYKSLMQRYHPDRNPGNEGAADIARRITSAYGVLSDPVAKSSYDHLLAETLLRETSSNIVRIYSQDTNSDSRANIAKDANKDEVLPTNFFLVLLFLVCVAITLSIYLHLVEKGQQETLYSEEYSKTMGNLNAKRLEDEERHEEIQQKERERRLISPLPDNMEFVVHDSKYRFGGVDKGHRLVIPKITVFISKNQFEKIVKKIDEHRSLILRDLEGAMTSFTYRELIRNDAEERIQEKVKYVINAVVLGPEKAKEACPYGATPQQEKENVSLGFPCLGVQSIILDQQFSIH